MSSSLVIQTSFLGDVVLTTPLIAELAARGPVDIVTTKAGSKAFATHPGLRWVFVYDKRGADWGPHGLWRLARHVGAMKHDTAYLAQGSWRSALLARISGARERIGFDTSAGRPLYTRRIRYRTDRHHAERLWRLAAGDDAPDPEVERIRPRLFPSEEQRAAVDQLLRNVPRDGATLFALAPGSIWGTKRWPHFPALAQRLAPLHRVVVIGGDDDRALAADIAAAAGPERVVDATGRLSLLESADLLWRCAGLVTNDSLPQHLASAVGTPTVTVFGPTVPAFGFGPLAPRSATVGHEAMPCRPCHPHGPQRCPLTHWKCMRDLEVSAVEAKVHEILRR